MINEFQIAPFQALRVDYDDGFFLVCLVGKDYKDSAWEHLRTLTSVHEEAESEVLADAVRRWGSKLQLRCLNFQT